MRIAPALLVLLFQTGCGNVQRDVTDPPPLDAGHVASTIPVCPLDGTSNPGAPPELELLHPTGRERVVDEGVRALDLEAVITGEGAVAVTIQDAGGAHAVEPDGEGRFQASVALNADAATRICIVIQRAEPPVWQACFDTSLRLPLEFSFQPAAGSVVDGSTVTATGRIESGSASAVSANGIDGGLTGDNFVIPGVPLDVGWNYLDTRVTSTGGRAISQRHLVARQAGPTRAVEIDVAIPGCLRVGSAGPVTPSSSELPAPRRTSFVLSGPSSELYRGDLPLDCFETSCAPRAEIRVPELPEAMRLELFDSAGYLVGSAALPLP